MRQDDLFWPEARCGLCVHRNASGQAQPLGDCTPVGTRHTNEAACDFYFPMDQLYAACAPKVRTR